MRNKRYPTAEEFRKMFRSFMIKLVLIAFTIALFTPAANAESGGITWKTRKAGKCYSTTIYSNGKAAGVIKTSKRLPVKVLTSKKCTAGKVTKRCGKYILVEKINGKCINSKGDGKTSSGHCIKYRHARKGDKFTTYAVYADTKYIDDIAVRIDIRR